ncbi:MAG: phosphoribosylanthranilate isomerase [Arenicella sp.]|jgi:phosphoribosylanthranilate isomerase
MIVDSVKVQNRTRIKICGMTNVAQVEHAVCLGVDAIGMILQANSPRLISLKQARLIRDVVPSFVTLVGVFVDADHEQIERSIDAVGLDLIQLHGLETDALGQTLSRPYIKAIRAKTAEQVNHDCAKFPNAQAILLDPYVKGQHGGTGQTLGLDLWPSSNVAQPLILAGGLSADNVAMRIRQFSPFAVDLNSGLEIEPGIKDLGLVTKAIEQINSTDAYLRSH